MTKLSSRLFFTVLVLGSASCRNAAPDTDDQNRAARDRSASAASSNATADVDASKSDTTKPDGAVTDPTSSGDGSSPTTSNGPLYLAVEGKGLVRLDQSGAKLLPTQSKGEIADLFIGPDDGVYVLDDRSLQKIEGEALVEIADLSAAEIAPVHSAVRSKTGELWIAGERGVGVRVGESWQLTPLAELGFETGEVTVALDHEGTVWAVSLTRALYREQDRWQPADVALLGEGVKLLNPQSSRVGRVHINNGHRVTRLGKENFDSVLVDFKAQLSYDADLDLNAEGHAVVASESCDLGRVTARPPTKIWRFSGEDYACKTLEAVALDSRLRVWVASREGLSVIEDDRSVHEYPAGSFAALDGRVRDMVVVGGGPELPAAAGR